MDKQGKSGLNWNAGTGMAAGAIFGALVALVVNVVTGSAEVWAWAVPVGLASGLAIGGGKAQHKEQT